MDISTDEDAHCDESYVHPSENTKENGASKNCHHEDCDF